VNYERRKGFVIGLGRDPQDKAKEVWMVRDTDSRRKYAVASIREGCELAAGLNVTFVVGLFGKNATIIKAVDVIIDKKETGQMNWYDSKEGIAEKITSLVGIHELIDERHVAGYDRGERMQEFVILGRWSTDTCGNFGKIGSDFIPKARWPEMPDVLTRAEFWEYVARHSLEEVHMSVSICEHGIPPANIQCVHCGETWSIENCWDTVVRHRTVVLPLADFVGRTLAEVKAHFGAKTNAIYRMQSDILIRHDRFIDLSPKYPEPEHDWQKGMPKNETGWVDEKHGITDEYVIQPDDEGFFNEWTFLHKDCDCIDLADKEADYFLEIFKEAGFDTESNLFIQERIPNQYCSCERCAPWYNFHTTIGLFTIGWRKRVISITFAGCEIPLFVLFPQEDVTKSKDSIHAWGREKAIEYLKTIKESEHVQEIPV